MEDVGQASEPVQNWTCQGQGTQDPSIMESTLACLFRGLHQPLDL